MQVFKLFFQIVNKNKISVFMTMIIAFAISLVFVNSAGSQFTFETANITIIDKDQSTASKALTKYMGEHTTIKDMKEAEIEEAIFYQDIDYVLYIPNGYEDMVKQNQEVTLDKKQRANAASAYVVDSYVDAFTNTLRSYYTYGKDTNISDAIKNTNTDLALKINTKQVVETSKTPVQYFFNFMGYSFFSSLIWGIGVVMVSLNRVDIKRRNVVAPTSNLKMNLQLALASSMLGLFLFVVSILFVYLLFEDGMQVSGAYLYILNLAVLLVPSIGISYLIGSAVKNSEVINGISNFLCLGLAFLGGCFVPQAMLSDSVLAISKFIPTYWFVRTNDIIYDSPVLNGKTLETIFQNMAILFLFGVIFFGVAIIVNRIKRRNVV